MKPEERVEPSATLPCEQTQNETTEMEVKMDDRRVLDIQGGSITIVRAGVTIEGEFNSPDDILIEGTVIGNVRATSVTIADGAHVSGMVNAAIVMVNGKIEGEVSCTRLQINTGGCVEGTVSHSILVVEPGAIIEGIVSRKKNTTIARTTEVIEAPMSALVAFESTR